MKRMCRCGKLIEYNLKYCDECNIKYLKERAAANKYYDKYKRNKKHADFYNSIPWEKTREYILRKYKGLDLYTFFIENKTEYADTVHHIVELSDDWNKRLDITNLFPLTSVSHNKIHQMYKENKEGTQELLFNLLKRWEKEYG